MLIALVTHKHKSGEDNYVYQRYLITKLDNCTIKMTNCIFTSIIEWQIVRISLKMSQNVHYIKCRITTAYITPWLINNAYSNKSSYLMVLNRKLSLNIFDKDVFYFLNDKC